MLYTLKNDSSQEPITPTVSISFNSTSRSFVVTDSENTFEKYEIGFYQLTPENLKYPCEVVQKILGKLYSSLPYAEISEAAMKAIEQICETNRLFF